MKPIKILIKKPIPIGPTWHSYREVPNGKLLLDENCPFDTEAKLCKWMYQMWGPGRYQILAWQKGYEGFWMFWLGDIHENGFIRDKRKNKDLDKLKGELYKAQSYEEKEDIEEEMEFERELWQMDTRVKRRGPMGMKTSRAGVFHPFEDY